MAGLVKGPAIFLAQFAGDSAPFNAFPSICQWAASLGYKGVQVPSWDGRLIDLAKAASSKAYCDELMGIAASHGLTITELSTHLQGQLVAVNPAYDDAFDAFAPKEVHGRPAERQKWAVEQMMMAARASRNFGHKRPCHVLGRACLAIRISLAAARPGPHRDRLRGARQALEADPRRVRRGGRRRRL